MFTAVGLERGVVQSRRGRHLRTCAPGATVVHAPELLQHQKFAVRAVGGARGFGVVAVERIAAGERILLERPLLDLLVVDEAEKQLPDGLLAPPMAYEEVIRGELEKMGPATRDAFWDLADVFAARVGRKTGSGILQTNAFQSGPHVRLFLTLSRLNHSCNPNVHRSWEGRADAMALHATREIEVGTELCQSYIFPLYRCTSDRQAELLQRWGFECKCEACSRPADERAKGDSVRKDLAVGDYKFKVYVDMARSNTLDDEGAAMLVEHLQEQVEAMCLGIKEEFGGNPAMACRVFTDAYEVAAACRHEGEATKFLQLANAAAFQASGSMSEELMPD